MAPTSPPSGGGLEALGGGFDMRRARVSSSDASDALRHPSSRHDRSLLVPRLTRNRAAMRRMRVLSLCCACLLLFPVAGTFLCISSYMAGSRNPLLLVTMGIVLPRYTYYIENGGLLAMLVRQVDSRGAKSYARARKYYERQRPLFETAAKAWELHDYFAEQGRAPEFQKMDSTLYDTLIGRLRVMEMQLRERKRDDFRVEKDKCACLAPPLER